MLNWIKSFISKIKWNNTNELRSTNQKSELRPREENQIKSGNKRYKRGRLGKLQQYKASVRTKASDKYVPGLPEDVWRQIIAELPLGGLSAVPFVSKLFNKIWNNMKIESSPTLLQIFGGINCSYSKLPPHRKLVDGFGMLSLLEQSLNLLHAKDYDNLLLVVQRLRRYSAMLASVVAENLHEYNPLPDCVRLVYYDMSPNNYLVAHRGTDSETPNESYEVRYALFGKNGHYVDVTYKCNLDVITGKSIKRIFLKVELKSLHDENHCEEFILPWTEVGKSVIYGGSEVAMWLGIFYKDSPINASMFQILRDLVVHPERVKLDVDHMTLEQVLQYSLRIFLNGDINWEYELGIMSLQAFARLTAFLRIKKHPKLRSIEDVNTNNVHEVASETQDDENIARRVGRKRKFDHISNSEPNDTQYEKPRKRLKLAKNKEAAGLIRDQPSSDELRNQEVAELFLNADYSVWESEARVFYDKNDDEEFPSVSDTSIFDQERVQEKYLMRKDKLSFALTSKDNPKSRVRFKLIVEEFYDVEEAEMQNSFQIHIRTPDQSFEFSGSESDSIEDVLHEVDQAVIDTLQLKHINTKQFALILCAICDQHENTEVMNKIRANREKH